MKSYIRAHISIVLFQLYVYIERFQSFDVLLLARDALRDFGYFFSTNNLRLVKNFPEIMNELSQQKCENREIVNFVQYFKAFVSNSRHILKFFGLLCLGPIRISDIFSRQIF